MEDLGELCMTYLSKEDLVKMCSDLKHTISASENGEIVEYDFGRCVAYEVNGCISVIWR